MLKNSVDFYVFIFFHMNDFEKKKTINALKTFKANKNAIQPIIGALQNSIEAKASNICIYLYETSLFKDNNEKKLEILI